MPNEATVHGNRFRRARFQRFTALLDEVRTAQPAPGPIRVLDLGGTAEYWKALQPEWASYELDLTIANLGRVTNADEGNMRFISADARAMPEFPDNAFDVIHSNSVIEHVGHWPEMVQMAAEVRRLAPRYYLQTPYFWFPMEPHFRSLFFHYLPEQTRARRLMKRKHGFRGPYATMDEAMDAVQTACLLDMTQMRALFPDARIEREKIVGLTKSLIAIR